MLRAAHWLLDRELGTLTSLLQQHPGFKLRFLGHSLGAGSATLASMILVSTHAHSASPAGCSSAPHLAPWPANSGKVGTLPSSSIFPGPCVWSCTRACHVLLCTGSVAGEAKSCRGWADPSWQTALSTAELPFAEGSQHRQQCAGC